MQWNEQTTLLCIWMGGSNLNVMWLESKMSKKKKKESYTQMITGSDIKYTHRKKFTTNETRRQKKLNGNGICASWGRTLKANSKR